MKSPIRRHMLKFLCAVVATLIGVCVAEVGLRTAGIGMPILYTPDEFCGSRMRPSTTGIWIFEGRGNISINSDGFRGPEFPKTKAENSFRIAVLGDSFIEALQVNEADSFCCQLEDILNESAPANCNYEVLNCAVSGYGTAQELLMLQNHVLQLAPDAVLLAIYPGNDLRNNLRKLENDDARPYFTIGPDNELKLDLSFQTSLPFTMAASDYEQAKASVVNRSRFLQLAKHVRQHGLSGKKEARLVVGIEDALLREVDTASYIYRQSTVPEHMEAWNVTERLIQEIAKTCDDSGVALLAFNISTPSQAYPDFSIQKRLLDHFNIPDFFYAERRLSTICEKSSIEFFPLASHLRSEVDDTELFLHGFSNTRFGTGHWNEQGHQLAARLVAAAIKNKIENDE
jgi:lysophospholipase L1-like esterase